jgi:hypothetical protein
VGVVDFLDVVAGVPIIINLLTGSLIYLHSSIANHRVALRFTLPSKGSRGFVLF